MNIFRAITPFWLVTAALMLSAGWLQPNHYLPWIAFHTDAWVAVILAILAVGLIGRTTEFAQWRPFTLLVLSLATIPFLQYIGGLIPFIGSAWISTSYILGFSLALAVGERWESITPSQAADFLFLAVGIASIISVGMALHQWLGLDGFELWIMRLGTTTRPFANFGQPNQLATLLLWGLLSCAWGVARRKIHLPVALLFSVYLIFGLALTESRTAWVTISMMIVVAWAWRKFCSARWIPLLISALGCFFLACTINLQSLSDV